MLLAPAIYVPIGNSGLPLWQEVPLTILGAGIAYELIVGAIALSKLPGERRLHKRVNAVEAAAGDSPVYGAPVVYAAATRLFGEVPAAWDAGDRERLARISDPGAPHFGHSPSPLCHVVRTSLGRDPSGFPYTGVRRDTSAAGVESRAPGTLSLPARHT